jgi:hypothetical protein
VKPLLTWRTSADLLQLHHYPSYIGNPKWKNGTTLWLMFDSCDLDGCCSSVGGTIRVRLRFFE